MALLDIVSNVSKELKYGEVSTVIGNSDRNVQEIFGFVRREGKDLVIRCNFQELREEATHTALASESQGDINTIAPGFDRFVPESGWNRTTLLPLIGPIDGQEWQRIKARDSSAVTPYFRLRGDGWLIYPAPVAGHTLAFEFYSNYWIKSSGGTKKAEFTADTDVSRINETLIEMGALWRYMEANGLDYAEKKRDYEIVLRNATLTNNAGRIRMGGRSRQLHRNDYRVTAAP